MKYGNDLVYVPDHL